MREALDLDAAAIPDTELQKLIDRASAKIARHCNVAADQTNAVTFARETLSETFKIDCHTPVLLLSRTPATIIDVSADGAAIDLSDLAYDSYFGDLERTDVALWPPGDIVVNYYAGYVTPGQEDLSADPPAPRTLPHDLEEACILTVRQDYYLKVREQGDPAVRSFESEGQFAISYNVDPANMRKALPHEVIDLVQQFVRYAD